MKQLPQRNNPRPPLRQLTVIPRPKIKQADSSPYNGVGPCLRQDPQFVLTGKMMRTRVDYSYFLEFCRLPPGTAVFNLRFCLRFNMFKEIFTGKTYFRTSNIFSFFYIDGDFYAVIHQNKLGKVLFAVSHRHKIAYSFSDLSWFYRGKTMDN